MRQLTIDIADTAPCWKCKKAVPAGGHNCHACGASNAVFGFDEFFAMLERGEVLNVRQGGLVVGRNNEADDIPLLAFVGNGLFQAIGFMQGGEYLMGAEASAKHCKHLEVINSETGEWRPFSTVPLTHETSVINVNLHAPTSGLWIHSVQFVVNRFATAKYLGELERLNGTR